MKAIPKTILDVLHANPNSDAMVPLLEFDLGSQGMLRYARYASDVTFESETFSAWPFAGQLSCQSKGKKIVTVSLTIDDAVQELRPYAIQTQWFRGCTLRLVIVCVTYLTLDYRWSDITYDIKQAVPQSGTLALTLGGRNPAKMRYPADRYFCDRCPYARGFKSDPRCGYSGSESTCSGTLADCVARGNETRWGGWLGLDPNSARLVIPAGLRT